MAADLAAAERAALCDLFAEVGPDAPTLCEGWTAADLAAHLVVRERRPVAAIGILVPAMSKVTERAMEDEKAKGYEAVVARVRNGPPPGPFRFGPLRAANLNEYYVHHEDVRRANGLEPRTGYDDLDRALWRLLGRTARLSTRGVGAGVVLERAGTGDRLVAKAGEPAAVLTGEPGELLLYLLGRRRAARVVVGGDEEAVTALRGTTLGL